MALFPKPLKQVLERTTRPIATKRGFSETRIITDWALIVGEHIAGYATPLKLSFPKDKNTGGNLTVVAHPAYALEIQQMSPMILDKIASYVGFRAVDRITIEQAYSALPETKAEPPAPAAPTTTTSSDPLEAALERLARIRASKG